MLACGGPQIAGRPAGLAVVHARLTYRCTGVPGGGSLSYQLRLAHPGEDEVTMQYARIGKACVGLRHDPSYPVGGPASMTLHLLDAVPCPGASAAEPRPPIADWPQLPVTLFYELDGREVASAAVFEGGSVSSSACDELIVH